MLQPVDEKPASRTAASSRFQRAMRYVGPIVAIALIASASVVLWRMVTSIALADVERAIADMPPWRIVAAFVLTAIGVASLAGYDMLAVKVVRSRPPISLQRAAVTGAIANVFANALGFPLLSGGSARYRLYSMVGASLSVVGRVIAMSWVTMWTGILAVLGLFLLLAPHDAPAVFANHGIDMAIGGILLSALAGFVFWVGRKRRAIRLGGWTIRLPGPGIAVGMVVVGSVDLLTAAGALWVLLPADAAPDLARYIVTYTVGLIAGIAAGTPGGIGVFEAAIVTGLHTGERPDVAASLILFRVIYFIVPLILALALMGAVEWRHRRMVRLQRRLGISDDHISL